MLLLSSVNLKLRDLAASLIPHLMHYAETGRLRPGVSSASKGTFDDFPDEFDPEAVHIVVDYLSHHWMPPDVKPAYDELVRGLRYDS